MLNRSVLFAMANRLHYRAGLSRSAALSHAWELVRVKEPEYTKTRESAMRSASGYWGDWPSAGCTVFRPGWSGSRGTPRTR